MTISYKIIKKYSVPLEKQMMKIGKTQKKAMDSLHKAGNLCNDRYFIDDTYRTLKDVGGKPGDGALEIYRDLADNIRTLESYIQRHEDKKQNPSYEPLISDMDKFRMEVRYLNDLAEQTPPEVMTEIKNMVKKYVDDGKKFGFKGDTAVIVLSFASVILLRYFNIIDWSWYIVVPAAIACMVIVPATISMLVNTRKK